MAGPPLTHDICHTSGRLPLAGMPPPRRASRLGVREGFLVEVVPGGQCTRGGDLAGGRSMGLP